MVPGRYDYFEHRADMGIEGCGSSMEEAFAQAARALFDLMLDIGQVRPQKRVSIRCRAHDREELLVEWLNELLSCADIEGLALGRFQVDRLGKNDLEGSAWGEPFDPRRHHPKTEVKAATYAMLFVGPEGDEQVARCVVDL